MQISSGSKEMAIGLIDGPVRIDHPDLYTESIRLLPAKTSGGCSNPDNLACRHGTSIAGILTGKRGGYAPSICPHCTLIVRPIFSETPVNGVTPTSSPTELALAIKDCINARARIINISAAPSQISMKKEPLLINALNLATRLGVIVVAAAGNQGGIGATPITSHPWVIPVAACDKKGKPLALTNLGASIGRNGLLAPGYQVRSLGVDNKPAFIGGTSASTPYVTGAIALLWSIFPAASAIQIKAAVMQTYLRHRTSVTPPLLNAWAAYEALSIAYK